MSMYSMRGKKLEFAQYIRYSH